MITGNAIYHFVATASNCKYVTWHHSWRYQAATQWQDYYTPSTLVGAEFSVHWNSSIVDHPKILPAARSMYQSQSRYSKHQCFWERHLLYREREKRTDLPRAADSLPASIPSARTCWAGMLNGLMKAQCWCRRESTFESCPTGSPCSRRITTPGCCFTHSQKENLDLGTKG